MKPAPVLLRKFTTKAICAARGIDRDGEHVSTMLFVQPSDNVATGTLHLLIPKSLGGMEPGVYQLTVKFVGPS